MAQHHTREAINDSYQRSEFINWVKAKDTIVDTLFILGPSNEEHLADLGRHLPDSNLADLAQ